MEELVSVVVPVYGAEAYLDRCVTSLVRQTYRNLEIILVEDGSPDGSAALCDAWAERDSRIVVIHKENAGAGLARNTGLDRASGSYLLFVDSDDRIDETTVEKCLAEAKRTGADVVMFGRSDLYPDGTLRPKAIPTDTCFFEGAAVREDILPGLFTYERGMGISVWGKLFAAPVVQAHGVRFPSEREVFSEDACFVLEAFAHVTAVAILRENLYHYFKNGSSLTHTYKKDLQGLNDRYLQRSLALCDTFAYPHRVTRYVYARYRTYAIAGMKLVLDAPLPKAQRRAELQAMFRNPLLHQAVGEEWIGTDLRSQQVFWRLFRWRCYPLCSLILAYKAYRKH